MKAVKAIYNILANDTPVTNVFGTQIYPQKVDEAATYPLCIVTNVAIDPFTTQIGASAVDRFRVQVDHIADKYDDCVTGYEATRAALERTTGTYNTVQVMDIFFLTSFDTLMDGETKKTGITSEYYVLIKN